MNVAFVGLGVMGQPMARNLLHAGFGVVAFTRNASVLDQFVAEGARRAKNPADAASQADVAITMLPDSSAVESVIAGEGGIFEGARANTLIIDMSTIHPQVSRTLASLARARDLQMLDAPVSGGDVGARDGSLSIMVGGDQADLERARPILDALGKTVVHVGPHGAGQIVKACNQIVVGITYAAVAEALVLGSKAGVAPDKILDVLSGGLASNRIMEVRRHNFLEHDFRPGFTIDLHHKDLGIALSEAGDMNVPLQLAATVQQMLRQLRAEGKADLDHSALLTVIEESANHRIGGSA